MKTEKKIFFVPLDYEQNKAFKDTGLVPYCFLKQITPELEDEIWKEVKNVFYDLMAGGYTIDEFEMRAVFDATIQKLKEKVENDALRYPKG